MLEAGLGSKSNTIVTENIYRKSVENGVTSFDIHVPGYGCRTGPMYKKHMDDYFHHPKVLTTLSEKELLPVDKNENSHYLAYLKTHEKSSLHHYERLCLEQDFVNHILKDA